MGCNAIRVISPYDIKFLDACEEKGMLLVCEADFTVRKGPRRVKKRDSDPLDRPVALVGEMVERLKNRASVICWSLGGCSSFGSGVLKELVRSLDDTRAINCEGDTRFLASDFFSAADCSDEALSDIVAHKTITDGHLLGRRVPFTRYANKPFFLVNAEPDEKKIKKKSAFIRANDRTLGMLIDVTGLDELSALSGVFCEAAEHAKGEEPDE